MPQGHNSRAVEQDSNNVNRDNYQIVATLTSRPTISATDGVGCQHLWAGGECGQCEYFAPGVQSPLVGSNEAQGIEHLGMEAGARVAASTYRLGRSVCPMAPDRMPAVKGMAAGNIEVSASSIRLNNQASHF